MWGGRNIQQSGRSMPLFTVTMKSNGSTNEKERPSRAIHAASIAAGYPEDDIFQRFLSLGPSDFRVDLYYPALPKPRTDQMLMIEVLVSSGTDTSRKQGLVAALVEKLGEARHRPKRHNGVLFGDRSRDRIIRWRPVRTTCCLRLITAHGIVAAWLRRSRS
jgi:Tautomerase enzyme